MAVSNNIVTLLPPNKRDATLVAQCAAFDQLEHELQEQDHTHDQSKPADRRNCSIYDSVAQVDELYDVCEELVATLCQYHARTLVGIAARVRTLLYLSPEVFKPSDTEAWDVRMVGALLRDLRTVLKVDDA